MEKTLTIDCREGKHGGNCLLCQCGCHAYKDGYGERKNDIKLYLRLHEVQMFVLNEHAGFCSRTGKGLVTAMFCWDHRISRGPGYDNMPFVIGEDRFSCSRHFDGTPCLIGDSPQATCYGKPQCGKCRAVDQMDYRQTAYYDISTCKVCGNEVAHSIGD